MRVLGFALFVMFCLAACSTLKQGSSLPAGVPESAHVVAVVPGNAQVSAFLGAFEVTYTQPRTLVLDPLKTPTISAVTDKFTVEFDKRDASRVSIFGQTDNYRAKWTGTVNGAPFAADMTFRSDDYSKKPESGESTIQRVLQLTFTGEGVEGCDFVATDVGVTMPAVFMKFRPSGDKVTMREVPGLVSFGSAVQYGTVGCLTWSGQTFVLDCAGDQVFLKEGRVYSARQLSRAEQAEVAMVEVLQRVLQIMGK